MGERERAHLVVQPGHVYVYMPSTLRMRALRANVKPAHCKFKGRTFSANFSELSKRLACFLSQGRRSRGGGQGGKCPPNITFGGALPPQLCSEKAMYMYIICVRTNIRNARDHAAWLTRACALQICLMKKRLSVILGAENSTKYDLAPPFYSFSAAAPVSTTDHPCT